MSPQQTDLESRFLQMQDEGLVVYHSDDEFGQPLFTLYTSNGAPFDYAHKSEIIEYIETGTFEYNDFLN
jgi:hypothetical protein